MIPQKISRVIARGLQNPCSEIKRQYWNIRDLLFVYKINDRHWYLGDFYPDYLAHGNAAQFIRKKASEYCHGKGLDIGGGKWPLEGAILVDDNENMNAYNLSNFVDNSLDYVFSSHCLEHLTRWEEALTLWIRKIKAGGILFLYLPHESMKMWSPGGPWVREHHVWAPTVNSLIPVIERNGMRILDYNPGRDDAWSFHIVAEKKKES
jgi:SAM-dependent methyltransferase